MQIYKRQHKWHTKDPDNYMGGLGLAPIAFLASAAATLSRQEAILPEQICGEDDPTIPCTVRVEDYNTKS